MCQECGNLTIDDLDKEMYEFKNHFDLLYFSMNTLLHITYNGWYYCYCGDTDKCLMCWVSQIFDGFQKKYIEKMFDEKVLNLERKKLYFYLIQLFSILYQEYTYGGHDGYSGETWSIGLEDSLRYDEKIQLAKKRGLGRV